MQRFGMFKIVTLVICLAILAGLTVPAMAQSGVPKNLLDWAIAKKLTVTTGGAEFQSDVSFTSDSDVTMAGDVTVSGDTTMSGDLTMSGDMTMTGNLTNRSLYLRYQDVVAAPSIYAAASVATTTTSITTSILGIETPRNIVVSLTSDAQRSAGNITVAGIDARGNSATEILAMTAITDAQTLTGVVPWISITSFAIPTQTAAFTISVAGGQKFGLPLVPAVAGDLYHLTVNATPQAAPTVNATYGTFDPVSTPAASVDYNVWIKQ